MGIVLDSLKADEAAREAVCSWCFLPCLGSFLCQSRRTEMWLPLLSLADYPTRPMCVSDRLNHAAIRHSPAEESQERGVERLRGTTRILPSCSLPAAFLQPPSPWAAYQEECSPVLPEMGSTPNFHEGLSFGE